MPQGHIISSEKDRYEIVAEGNEEGIVSLFAKGRGVFRDKSIRPMIGDYVIWTKGEQDEEATITEILPRKNSLLRPPVANVDQVLVVETLVEPMVNALQLDKLLVVLEKRRFSVLLCFNKMDRTDESLRDAWVKRYRLAGYPVFSINAMDGSGVPPLEEALAGKLTAIAGPSGAGKSTLIRRLSGEDSIVIGSLSAKTARGKQTTRTSRLFHIGEEAYIFDTPGFSSLDLRDFASPAEVGEAFPDICRYKAMCRFRNCTHRKEPHCAVKEAVESGNMAPERYASYLALYAEIENRS